MVVARLFAGSILRDLKTGDDDVNDFKLVISELCKLCFQPESVKTSIDIAVQNNESVEVLVGPVKNHFNKDKLVEEDFWSLSIVQSLSNSLDYINKDGQTYIRVLKQLAPLPYPRY